MVLSFCFTFDCTRNQISIILDLNVNWVITLYFENNMALGEGLSVFTRPCPQ